MASSLLRYVHVAISYYMLITLARTFSACAIANRYKISQADLNPAFSERVYTKNKCTISKTKQTVFGFYWTSNSY